MICRIFPL